VKAKWFLVLWIIEADRTINFAFTPGTKIKISES